MARIAVGGFQHETNTFAPLKATYRDFEMADGWPGLTEGPAILTAFDGEVARRRAQRVGATAFFVKPFSAESLMRNLAPLIRSGIEAAQRAQR